MFWVVWTGFGLSMRFVDNNISRIAPVLSFKVSGAARSGTMMHLCCVTCVWSVTVQDVPEQSVGKAYTKVIKNILGYGKGRKFWMLFEYWIWFVNYLFYLFCMSERFSQIICLWNNLKNQSYSMSVWNQIHIQIHYTPYTSLSFQCSNLDMVVGEMSLMGQKVVRLDWNHPLWF